MSGKKDDAATVTPETDAPPPPDPTANSRDAVVATLSRSAFF